MKGPFEVLTRDNSASFDTAQAAAVCMMYCSEQDVPAIAIVSETNEVLTSTHGVIKVLSLWKAQGRKENEAKGTG
jgi:hypothetical protein